MESNKTEKEIRERLFRFSTEKIENNEKRFRKFRIRPINLGLICGLICEVGFPPPKD